MLSACSRGSSAAITAGPADVYAGAPSVADLRTQLGGSDWWPGPPTFGILPLNAASTPPEVRFFVILRFANVGTAEKMEIEYTIYDKTSIASTRMSNLKARLGAGVKGPTVGDQVLYYGQQRSSGGAPFETITFIRVGQAVIEAVWDRKDDFPNASQLGKIGGAVVAKFRKVLAGKVRATPSTGSDAALLPPAGPYITKLGSASLPIEVVPLLLNATAPLQLVQLFRSRGVTDLTYGDYVLNADTRMEVRATEITFSSSVDAGSLLDLFRGSSTLNSNGVLSIYDTVAGPGQYELVFSSGDKLGLLICRSTSELEAASRACEAPMENVAAAWKATLGG
jgi:hypothetical protein